MKVHMLESGHEVYSSNAYLLCGSNNRMPDINTLIDPGADSNIVNRIKQINTGVGKKAVSQIFITHNHFDHTQCIGLITKEWKSKIKAYSKNLKADQVLKHNDVIKVADTWCQVIHIPIHSSDSVCFFFPEEKLLFSGDTPMNILSVDISYDDLFLQRLEELSKLNISVIYPGHGDLIQNGSEVINRSLKCLTDHKKLWKII